MRRLILMILGGLMLAGGVSAQDLPEGDRGQGQQLAAKCRTCHGLDGASRLPNAPNIGGEPVAYLEAQLLAFREGRRQNEMMSVVITDLGDQDIADLAAWYGGHQPAATLSADPSGAPQQCVSCHGETGIAVAEDVPNLAGDPEMYLQAQLEAFRSGERVNETMNEIAAALSDDEIRSAAKWYSSSMLEIETVE